MNDRNTKPGHTLNTYGFIAGDPMLGTWHRRPEWPTPSTHQDRLSADFARPSLGCGDGNCVSIGFEKALANDHVHSSIPQHLAVDAVETRDLFVLVVHQCLPRVSRVRFIQPAPSETFAVAAVLRVVRTVHHQLLGHATDVHARTPSSSVRGRAVVSRQLCCCCVVVIVFWRGKYMGLVSSGGAGR
jgi:hypothetical protein